MNINHIHSLWNSGANQPTPDDVAQLKSRLVHRLKIKRIVEIAWLCWTILLLIAATTIAARTMFFSDRFAFLSEWAVIPLLVLPWICAAFFLRNYRARRAGFIAADESIANAIRAAVADNRARQTKSKAVGVLLLVTALVLPLVIHQLSSVGKVSSREAVSMAVFFAAILITSGTVVALKFYRSLRPEESRLDALLREYDSSGA